MELNGNNKIEFDLEELMPLLLQDKQEGFRKIGEKLLNAVLEKEFEAYIGASRHERSEERTDYRNGYKERQLKTTLGELNHMPEAGGSRRSCSRTTPGSTRRWYR